MSSEIEYENFNSNFWSKIMQHSIDLIVFTLITFVLEQKHKLARAKKKKGLSVIETRES